MQIAVLGPLEVRTPDGVLDVAGARLRALLIRLAIAAPAPVTVSTLADALWGDDPPTEVANALQSLVSRLRRALHDPDIVRQVPGGYQLMITSDDLDLRRFTRLARVGRDELAASRFADAATTLRTALALWRSDAVDSAIERDGALLARLQDQHLDVLADRIAADLALGRAANVIGELDQLVLDHPLRERLTLLLVRALGTDGRVPEALSAYERARRTLADELGIDPSPELQAAHVALLRGEPLIARAAPVLDASDAPPAEAAGRLLSPSNLRSQLTSFVGREEDVRRIGKLLDEGRLVSLVGPGGAGKTRLANESVGRLSDQLSDAVWIAELAPVSDPVEVPQVVLAALGLRDSTLIDASGANSPRDATTRLVESFTERECVLVLDNCEHLIDAAAALVDELLARCPGLRVLTTSREPLGVYGEVLVVVPPLGQPAVNATPEDAMTFPATQLFADRAVAVRPGFVIDELTVGPVVEIVRRLDGLPLAIELAAARLRSMPVEQVAARLTDRFRLLTGGSRTALPRHRTLLAVVEWSWDLLTEDERRLARRLAVFVGGITVSSAAAVCASSELPQDEVEDLLASLVDKSLLQVVVAESAVGRYRMLETLREFGLERMAAVDEVGPIRAAHAKHFGALARLADPQLRTRDQLVWLDIVNAERDNIVAALRFLADDGQAEASLDVATAMSWYWVLTGRHGDAANWTGFALAASGDIDSTHRLVGEALVAINSAASIWAGPPEEMERHMRRIAELNNQLDDVEAIRLHPLIRVLRPVLAMFSDDHERAAALIEESLATGDPWTVAASRTFRAALAENAGDAEAARVDAHASLAEFRELGERWGMGNCLQMLGPLDALAGDLDQAVLDFREALALFGELGATDDEAQIRLRLADVLFRQGKVEEAQREIEVALNRSQARDRETMFGTNNESLYANIMIADIERQLGNVEQARLRSTEAFGLIERVAAPHPAQSHLLAIAHMVAAKIDLAESAIDQATARLVDAYQVGLGTRDMPIVGNVGVGVAMLAAALERYVEAAEMLGAAARLRGGDDRTAFDIRQLQAVLVEQLEPGGSVAAYTRGRELSRDDALARLDPATLSG